MRSVASYSAPAIKSTVGPSLDGKPYIEHHPMLGYRYIAGANLELPRPDGGTYRIGINSQGIRSDREYSFSAPKGIYRIVVCGDSMAAGQFVKNACRFSELLERRIPRLEVINLALEGSGTDQQLMLYERVGLQYEHHLVMLLPFLQNIRRNMVEAREGFDAKSGEKVLRPKPRYELVNGQLVLRNVPVPKEVSSGRLRQSSCTDTQRSLADQFKAKLNVLPGTALLKKAVYRMVPWEPFPEYRDPYSKEWQLMAAILREFKRRAGNRPFVLVPTFYSSYVRFRMARNYWDRYSSLGTTTGIHVIDLLPHFRKLGTDAVKCFQEPLDCHFSTYGHLVLADALQAEMNQLRLLPI